MNLEQTKDKKLPQPLVDEIDFDFKPITSGLGFHHPKTTEPKSAFMDRSVAVTPMPLPAPAHKKDMSVYQSDLSLFYGNAQPENVPVLEERPQEDVYFKLASKGQRIFAYLTDLFLIAGVLGIVLTVMARTISMDLVEVWTLYPNEITPLVVTLFSGFYLIYFSIFEKASQSTLGKNIFAIRVVGLNNKPLSLFALLLRSFISLLNFISLGLFSWFDLQNKVTGSKVIRID
jgi:uncharacterized RDD family membrane protein YckC